MKQVNIHAAKTNLSKLVEEAAKGKPFIIAKAGIPKVVVSSFKKPIDPGNRIGFLKGMIEVPDDFDEMGRKDISEMYEGCHK